MLCLECFAAQIVCCSGVLRHASCWDFRASSHPSVDNCSFSAKNDDFPSISNYRQKAWYADIPNLDVT